MEIKLFEVKFELENGQTLSVLIAEGSADAAKDAAHAMMLSATESRCGCRIDARWEFEDVTAQEVTVSEAA